MSEEDKAILDLLPEMVEMDYMLNHNEYGANPPILYVFGELANKLLIGYGYEVFEVEIGSGDTIGSYILDGGLSDEEKIRLKLLISNKIPKRELSEGLFKNIDKLNIKVLSIDEKEAIENDSLIEKFENDGVFGYLDISRIIFSNNYQNGFVSFSFFCGEACAWNSVIEIEKINDKWIKKREISGGIAFNFLECKGVLTTLSLAQACKQ